MAGVFGLKPAAAGEAPQAPTMKVIEVSDGMPAAHPDQGDGLVEYEVARHQASLPLLDDPAQDRVVRVVLSR